MEHLLERSHSCVGRYTRRIHEERSHLLLPSLIDLTPGHFTSRTFEVFRLDISDEKAIGPKEKRVVGPTGFAESGEHFGPYGLVASLVFFQPFGANLKHKTDPLHGVQRESAASRCPDGRFRSMGSAIRVSGIRRDARVVAFGALHRDPFQIAGASKSLKRILGKTF